MPEGGWDRLVSPALALSCFNTQPPEGGWLGPRHPCKRVIVFQHTAARRRLANHNKYSLLHSPVSTHSRPKAAGPDPLVHKSPSNGFNTQPPEGGWPRVVEHAAHFFGFQHTAARRRLAYTLPLPLMTVLFQHTAARRRLVDALAIYNVLKAVSTHSRPKAAGPSPQTFA